MMPTTPRISTRCAHWGWDDHEYFGYSVFRELTGHESMIGMSALSVLGRRLPKECCDVLEDIICVSTLADPRIWPLKIARLVASYGSTMPAVAASLSIQEGARIGPWKAADAARALGEMHEAMRGQHDNKAVVHEVAEWYFATHRVVPGFGTPYRDRDERLAALHQCMIQRQRNQLPYWGTMCAVSDAAHLLYHIAPNIVFGTAAALLDMEMSCDEIGAITTVLFQHMFMANAVEGARTRATSLRELPEGFLRFVGRPSRISPRAVERTSEMWTSKGKNKPKRKGAPT